MIARMTDPEQPEDDYSRSARCDTCQLGPSLCLCSRLPLVSLDYRFIVIRHRSEIGRQSGTGGLVGRLIEGSKILDHGMPAGPFDPSPLRDSTRDYRLVYPGLQATPLDAESIPDPSSTAFVLLDASWRKARRMTTRIPELCGMPMVSLGGGEQGESLRRPPAPGRFFTLEAAVRVVETMRDEGPASVLRGALDLVVRRRRHERGLIPKAKLYEFEAETEGDRASWDG